MWYIKYISKLMIFIESKNMSPDERRQSIKDRIEFGDFTLFDVVAASKYQGLKHYLDGKVDAKDTNIYAVEQALESLESKTTSGNTI